MTRKNYVFVDYENVHDIDLERVKDKPVEVTLVLGPAHKTLPVALFKSLKRYAEQIKLVETVRAGKNALDLVLAMELGAVRQADPAGYFHIVSKDKDFDVLVEQLRQNKALAARHDSMRDIAILMKPEERAVWAAARLQGAPQTRPKKRDTLESHLQALFARTLPEDAVKTLIKALETANVIQISKDGDVTYKK